MSAITFRQQTITPLDSPLSTPHRTNYRLQRAVAALFAVVSLAYLAMVLKPREYSQEIEPVGLETTGLAALAALFWAVFKQPHERAPRFSSCSNTPAALPWGAQLLANSTVDAFSACQGQDGMVLEAWVQNGTLNYRYLNSTTTTPANTLRFLAPGSGTSAHNVYAISNYISPIPYGIVATYFSNNKPQVDIFKIDGDQVIYSNNYYYPYNPITSLTSIPFSTEVFAAFALNLGAWTGACAVFGGIYLGGGACVDNSVIYMGPSISLVTIETGVAVFYAQQSIYAVGIGVFAAIVAPSIYGETVLLAPKQLTFGMIKDLASTVLPNGNFVVVWIDESGPNANVPSYQIFDPDLDPLSDVFQLNICNNDLPIDAIQVIPFRDGFIIGTTAQELLQYKNFGFYVDSTGAQVMGQFPFTSPFGTVSGFSLSPLNGREIEVLLGGSSGNLVSATYLIDSPPYVQNPLPTLSIPLGHSTQNITEVIGDSDSKYGDTLTYVILNAPVWSSFDPETLILSFDPKFKDSGPFSLVLRATDEAQESVDYLIQGAVVPGPSPEITPLGVVTAVVGDLFRVTISVQSANRPLNVTVIFSAAWLQFNNLTLSGTPGHGDVTEVAVTVIAVDSEGEESTMTFYIDVQGDTWLVTVAKIGGYLGLGISALGLARWAYIKRAENKKRATEALLYLRKTLGCVSSKGDDVELRSSSDA